MTGLTGKKVCPLVQKTGIQYGCCFGEGACVFFGFVNQRRISRIGHGCFAGVFFRDDIALIVEKRMIPGLILHGRIRQHQILADIDNIKIFNIRVKCFKETQTLFIRSCPEITEPFGNESGNAVAFFDGIGFGIGFEDFGNFRDGNKWNRNHAGGLTRQGARLQLLQRNKNTLIGAYTVDVMDMFIQSFKNT